MKKRKGIILSLIMAVSMLFNLTAVSATAAEKEKITLKNLPAYSGEAYVELNNNVPSFKKSQLTKKSFEQYSEQDKLGRCGVAFANVGTDIMPTEERGKIKNLMKMRSAEWQKNVPAKMMK